MTTANSRLTQNEKDIAEMRVMIAKNTDATNRTFTGRSNFMVCASRQIDRLNDQVGINPPCQLEVPE